MIMRSLLVAGFACAASLVMNVAATAEDAAAPIQAAALDGVSFSDVGSGFGEPAKWRLSVSTNAEERLPDFAPVGFHQSEHGARRYEVALRARALGGVDVAVAQHGAIDFDGSGDVSRRARGAEVRLGNGVNMPRLRTPSWDNPTWYLFAGADDEAVTWRPGERNDFGDPAASFALQDRVEIGDRQAGLTYQRGPIQASLAYVERTVDARTAGRTISREERFAGVTLTMRH